MQLGRSIPIIITDNMVFKGEDDHVPAPCENLQSNIRIICWLARDFEFIIAIIVAIMHAFDSKSIS